MDKSKKRIRIIFAVLCLSLVFSILFDIALNEAFSHERGTDLTETSTTPVLYNTDLELFSALTESHPLFAAQLAKENNVNENDSSDRTDMCVLPGLDATKTINSKKQKEEICTSMTPQGISVTDKYIFVSAYCHAHKHNSVIYVIDRKSEKFIKELVLATQSHVGGLAFDESEKLLWVTEYKDKKSYVASITLEDIENFKFDNGLDVISYKDFIELSKLKRASFISFYNGYLVAGYFDVLKDGYCNFYDLKQSDKKVKPIEKRDTTTLVQSVASIEDCTALTRSFGPLISELLIFDGTSILKNNRHFKKEEAELTLDLPQKLEQICFYNDEIYMLFESAASSYRFFGDDSIDRIVKFKF